MRSVLPNGNYRTASGSTVLIDGEHGGNSTVAFEWCDEPNACCDCRANVYPVNGGNGEWWLTWSCDKCDGGKALLVADR